MPRSKKLPFFLLCAAFVSIEPSEGLSQDREASLIQQHKLIASLRDMESLARELYFDQSFVLLHLHGKRTERVGSYNSPPRMLRAAVDSRFVPPINRFKSRIDKLDGLDTGQKAQITDAVQSMQNAIEIGYAIADEMEAGNLELATAVFYETALPEFKSCWADFYTVISELETAYPRK